MLVHACCASLHIHPSEDTVDTFCHLHLGPPSCHTVSYCYVPLASPRTAHCIARTCTLCLGTVAAAGFRWVLELPPRATEYCCWLSVGIGLANGVTARGCVRAAAVHEHVSVGGTQKQCGCNQLFFLGKAGSGCWIGGLGDTASMLKLHCLSPPPHVVTGAWGKSVVVGHRRRHWRRPQAWAVDGVRRQGAGSLLHLGVSLSFSLA